MCGIYGAVAFTVNGSKRIQQLRLALQMGSLQRGRDGHGEYEWNWGYLGVSRAQPLPEGERVPIPLNLDGLIMAFNGTISNDEELCEQYNFPFNNVDTWTAARLWKSKGWRACNELVGGFAFAVYDEWTDTLTLAKNFKTLWYVITSDFLAFSSEPEPLLRSESLISVEYPRRFPTNHAVEINRDGDQASIKEHKIERKVWGSVPELDHNAAVIVTSGGIDSITATYIAAKHHKKEVTLMNFDYGQRARQKEWEAVQYAANDLGCECIQVDLTILGDWGSSPLTNSSQELPLGKRSVESTLCWVPGRNMLMVACAASFAEASGAKYVYYGNNMEEEATGYSDNDLEFIHVFNELLEFGTLQGVQIHRALGRLMKKEILVVGDYLGVDYSKTWSCDEGYNIPCGRCGCCTTRRHAFMRAGLQDEQQYKYSMTDKYPWNTTSPSDINELLALI